MTSLDHAASGRTAMICCRRPMTLIEVTSPLAEGSSKLSLETCSSCGRHIWQRDGCDLQRDEVLAIVRDRVAEGPSPRVPRPRKARPSRAKGLPDS